MKCVAGLLAQARDAQGVPHGRHLLEITASPVQDGHVVHSLDVWCLAEVLDRGDEALGAGIQEMHGMGAVGLLTPCQRLLILMLAEASGLAEADEPYGDEIVSGTHTHTVIHGTRISCMSE